MSGAYNSIKIEEESLQVTVKMDAQQAPNQVRVENRRISDVTLSGFVKQAIVESLFSVPNSKDELSVNAAGILSSCPHLRQERRL